MTNKKGNPEPSYCVQFAVDYEAKIITGVVVTDENNIINTPFPKYLTNV